MITGLYSAGDSVFHRTSAGLKLAGLAGLGAGLVVFGNTTILILLAALVAWCFVSIAELGGQRLWTSTKPLLIWLVFIIGAQLWLGSAESAVVVVVRLLTLVWAASLVTLTTTLSDMSDAIVRLVQPLERFGVSPARVAFLIALTIRMIPALFEIVREVREAQRARGLERSFIAAFVPVLTRVLKYASELSVTLTARGYERWDKTA